MNDVFLVGGAKGGVGKSLLSAALLDRLRLSSPILIESDLTNSDVHHAYENTILSIPLDLQEHEPWLDFANAVDEFPDRPFVVNTRAANSQAIAEHGAKLTSALQVMGRHLVVFWVIDQFIDSLLLLKSFREAMPSSTVHVVKSGMNQGPKADWSLYNNSNTKAVIEAAGGRSLQFEYLALRLRVQFYTHRKTIEWMCLHQDGGLKIGDRGEAIRWRNANTAMFDSVLK